MVDMAHDSHNRRTRLFRIHGRRIGKLSEQGFRIIGLSLNGLMPHFLHDNHCRVLIEHLVNRNHLSHLHECLDNLSRLNRHLARQISNRNRFRHAHFAYNRFGRHRRSRCRIGPMLGFLGTRTPTRFLVTASVKGAARFKRTMRPGIFAPSIVAQTLGSSVIFKASFLRRFRFRRLGTFTTIDLLFFLDNRFCRCNGFGL